MPSGIYQIKNKINNKFYIGSSDFIRRRWREHTTSLNGNKHCNNYLQFSWNKYGADAFEFLILENCNSDKLIEREQIWIDWLKPEYNLSGTAGSPLGIKRSEEFKQKVRDRQLGSKHSKETKIKMSISQKGRRHSQESIIKIIEAKAVYGLNSDRVGMKYNKPNRIWDCPDGQKCKCDKCKTRKNDQQFYRRLRTGKR